MAEKTTEAEREISPSETTVWKIELALAVFGIILTALLAVSSLWLPFKIIIAVIIIFCTCFIKLTIIEESTAQDIFRLGAFRKALIQWQGQKLDDGWDVVPATGTEPAGPTVRGFTIPRLGGLRIVGIRFLDSVYWYNLRWQDIHQKGDKEEVAFHEKTINYVSLKDNTYWASIEKAETKAVEERIPVDVEFLITLKVKNPYKVIFRAPYNWVEKVIANINAILRSYVGRKTVDELIEARGATADITTELKQEYLIATELPEDWGVEVKTVRIRDLRMPEVYQRAAAAQKEQEMIAAGRAAETVGTVLATMAQASDKTVPEIQAEIAKNDATKKEFLELSVDLIKRKMAMEGKSFVDIRVSGADGQPLDNLVGVILAAFAAQQRMPQGATSATPIREEKPEKEKKRGVRSEDEAVDEIIRALTGK